MLFLYSRKIHSRFDWIARMQKMSHWQTHRFDWIQRTGMYKLPSWFFTRSRRYGILFAVSSWKSEPAYRKK